MGAEEQIREVVEPSQSITQTVIAGMPIPSDDRAEDRLERVEEAVVALYRGLRLAGRLIEDLSSKLDAR